MEPVRAKKAWAELGVDANGVANDVPDENFLGMPRLTKEMLALIQGFPPVAEKVGLEIRSCLKWKKF